MDSCKRFFVLILMIFLPGFLSAQIIISHTFHRVVYRIPYHKIKTGVNDCRNDFLREIAKDVLREPWLVQINISGNLGLSIVKDHGLNKLFISWRNPVITGDTLFRHFSTTDVLLPSSITMKLRWANRADTSGFTEETLSGKALPHGDSIICVHDIALYDPKVDTLMIRDVELSYDTAALSAFRNRLNLIHDYYASVSLLDSLQKFISDLHPGDHKLLPISYLKVSELCNVLERIDSRNFSGRLLLNGFDPSGLMGKYRQMFKQSRTAIYNVVDELHKAGAIPFPGGADLLASYFTSRAFSYVRRSYLMDQQQGLIYQDCLDHFFDHDPFPPEENVVSVLLSKMFPDAGKDTTARYISQRIYGSYRVSTQQLMEQRRYAEAFSMMENGRLFISGNPSLRGTAADDLLQSQAAQGICNSFIGIASSCISSHKYNMAETYLSKADQYAMEHAKYITSDSGYRAVFSELFFLRNVECDVLLEQKKYAEALDCYQQFETAYSARDLELVSNKLEEKKSFARMGLANISATNTEHALKNRSADTALYYYEQATALRQRAKTHEQVDTRLDSLAPVMARIKYRQIVQEGVSAYEKRQFTLAVTRLNDAKTLAEVYKIDRGREFDSLYKTAMKNYLIIRLSASQKKIWANQFDSAQLALQKTEAAGFDFGLLNDPGFTACLENFRVKIREQQCRNLLDSVDLRMIRADRAIALRNFINARVYLSQALDFARQMAVCNIPERPIMDTLAKYEPAAAYQQNLAGIGSLVASGNYAEAIIGLEENQRDYLSQKLDRFGLQMVGTYAFALEKSNPYLTGKAISYSIDRKMYQEALRFLFLAHDQGLPAEAMRKLQQDLGVQLANEDYQKNSGGDVSQSIAKHIPADGWLNFLRENYINEWNRQVKAGAPGSK